MIIWCTELSNHERYNMIVSNITNITQLFLCLLEAAFIIHLAQKSEGALWMGMKPQLSTLPPDSRPWFTNEMQNVLLSVKMTLDHWATVQLFSSLAQVRCFWRCFCFGSLQLLSTPCEALPSVWTGFAWQYHPCCLCTFSYPFSSFQSTLHLLCFDTLCTL